MTDLHEAALAVIADARALLQVYPRDEFMFRIDALEEALRAALAAETKPDLGKCAGCGEEITDYDGVVAYTEGTFCNRACAEAAAERAAEKPTPEPAEAEDVAKTVYWDLDCSGLEDAAPDIALITAALVSYADAHAKDAVAAERERAFSAGIQDERGRWEAGCPEFALTTERRRCVHDEWYCKPCQWENGFSHESNVVALTSGGRMPTHNGGAMSDKAKGIYGKFRIERADSTHLPGGKHHGCAYFVLDLDHDEFARAALRAYADACASKYPLLAQDLMDMVETYPEGGRCADDISMLPQTMADEMRRKLLEDSDGR